jgi:hypothetical protein
VPFILGFAQRYVASLRSEEAVIGHRRFSPVDNMKLKTDDMVATSIQTVILLLRQDAILFEVLVKCKRELIH